MIHTAGSFCFCKYFVNNLYTRAERVKYVLILGWNKDSEIDLLVQILTLSSGYVFKNGDISIAKLWTCKLNE